MAKYQSINEVPRRWRSLKGAPLSLAQIEGILQQAEASDKPFSVAITEAKEDFQGKHHVVAGFWIPKD